MKKLFVLTIGVAVVVGLAVYINAASEPPVRHQAPPVGPYKIYAAGRVEGATEETQLRPRAAGQVVEVLIREGDLVQQGQILLRLDDQAYVHEVALALADLNLAIAQRKMLENGSRPEERHEAKARYQAKLAELDQAKLDWERTRALRTNRAVSDQEVESVFSKVRILEGEVQAVKARAELLDAPARTDEVQIANARIEAAKARWELAKYNLERTKLRAPTAGQVLHVDTEPGEMAGPESERAAVVLANTEHYRVRAFVEELDAPRVRLGMTATVAADGLPGKKFAGRVIRLSPRMTNKQIWSDDPTERFDTKAREVWIELDQHEDLVLGLRVDVMIDADASSADPEQLVQASIN